MASNAGGEGKNRDSNGYRIWLSIDDSCTCEKQLTVVGAVVYNSYGARLFTAHTVMHQ